MVEDRTGHGIVWSQEAAEQEEIRATVEQLLAGELTADAATRIALLNNRSLQAEYEHLGIAQADLVQAGLLRNPRLFGSARRSSEHSAGTNTEVGLVFDFLDILLRPARKRLAEAEFEETKLRVSDAVLDLTARTRVAYYTFQASVQVEEVLSAIEEAAGAAHEFALRQRAAGNLSDLDLAAQQGLHEQARVEVAMAGVVTLAGRERLNRLMGLWGEDTGWTIPPRLPDLPETEAPLGQVESVAIAGRLDLAAERWRVESVARALSVTLHWRWVPLIDIGVETERETDGERVTGPALAIELPIFDQGQARVAKIESVLRQSRQRMEALAVDIRSEVREARGRLLSARAIAARYRDVMIPLRERLVAESQRFYNYMFIGVYQLLQAKQDEIEAYRGYIEAVRDYWIARTELERAVGGRLPAGDEPAGADPVPVPLPGEKGE